MQRLPAMWTLCVGAALASCGSTSLTTGPAGDMASTHPAAPELAVSVLLTGNPPRHEILLMDADGSNRRVLIGRSRRSHIRAVGGGEAWSPDGRWLAFAGEVSHALRRREDPLTDIFVVRADGSGLRRLTHLGHAREPVWSPDGRTIVFAEASFFRGDPNIFTSLAITLWRVNTNGSDSHALTQTVQGQLDLPGSFSPAGTRLAFTRRKPGTIGPGVGSEDGEIDTIRLDGTQLRTLAADAADPSFSRDGREIAFVSDRARNGTVATGEDEAAYANELYVMNADGQNARRLTYTNEQSESAPTWSPDGTRIAYERQDPRFTKIVAITNADGTCGTEIAAGPRGNLWYGKPAWRPGKAARGEGPLRCHR